LGRKVCTCFELPDIRLDNIVTPFSERREEEEFPEDTMIEESQDISTDTEVED
jgi:hypothetical protein